MTSKSLLTINYRLDDAQRFISSVEKEQYYFFVGNHINSNTIVQPYDNTQDTLLSAYYGMIFGKKIATNDINLAIRRIDWKTGVIYDMYDHSDINLYDSNFYVIVREGTQHDVFKCLENGGGKPSTVAPSRTNVSVDNNDFYYPTDGYRWKYMYSVSDGAADKFGTPNYFPVSTDSGVKANADPGAIDVIKVTSPGSGYANYLFGSFGISDIRLNGNPNIYGISTVGAKTANGFYNACYIYISSGAGAGQYRQIESYTSNSTYNFIELNDAFDFSDSPENGSVFEIYPSVLIKGDGAETTPAAARAIINSTGNTVSRIEMLNKGVGYNLASAIVLAANSVGVTSNAGVVPIYSPFGGHGYNTPVELGSKFACVSIKIYGNESNTVILQNDYSQIGIIKNPTFKKVTLNLTSNNRDFSTNEWVYKINPVQLQGTVSTTVNANNQLTTGLNVNGVNAHSIASVGTQLLLNYTTNYMIANVVSVSNTTITIDKAAVFNTGTGVANVFLAYASSVGFVDGFATNVVDLTDVLGEFKTDDKIIGDTTGTYANVSLVKITDVTKTFNTFLQCYRYTGTITSGVFVPDEQVHQVSDSIARANFHSTEIVGGTTYFYLTNQIGVFNTSGDDNTQTSEIIGNSSGAIGNLTNKYLPDLVFGSGEVFYIENGEAISRENEQSEIFKLVFQF